MAEVIMKKPKILLWDLESTPNRGYFWRTGKQFMGYRQIEKNRSIICGSYKWLGGKNIYTTSIGDKPRSYKNDPYDDKEPVTQLHKVLSKADMVIAHNGDRFDMKFFAARALKHGLPPLPIIHSVDTLKWAKRRFDLDSYSLDYIAKYLGLDAKGSAGGMKTWVDIVEKSCHKALGRMEKYNVQDIVVLEAVYLALRGYMTTHPNLNLYMNSPVPVCPNCGGIHLHKRGERTTRISVYQRYQCGDCGTWSHSGKMLRKAEVR